MLNRRILRVKAFKELYAYSIFRRPCEDALKELEASCEDARNLYLFMLALAPELAKAASARIEAARGKFNPTQEDLNPNMRFVQNSVSEYFATDPDFTKIAARKKLSWQQYDIFIGRLLDSVFSKDYFKAYMSMDGVEKADDCALFTQIYTEELEDNPDIYPILEDLCINWPDDLPYALTWCCHAFSALSRGYRWRLPELYISDEIKRSKPDADMSSDRAFVRRLLSNAVAGYERYFGMITAAVPDWDSDRLSPADIAIVILGLSETESFRDIPLRVTINEYVEISKYYSSNKSRQFVNGLLDRLAKQLSESTTTEIK